MLEQPDIVRAHVRRFVREYRRVRGSARTRGSESGNFSGGDKTVAHRLEALGFTVLNLNRPDWNRDELILACELVKINGWRQLDESYDGVKELSGGGEHATN